MDHFTQEFIDYLISKSIDWVTRQRNENLKESVDLSKIQQSIFERYFDKEILDKTKIRIVDKIENPEFYQDEIIRSLGIVQRLNFNEMVGITFDNCILIKNDIIDETDFNSTLFHELIHVTQYQVLGINNFIRFYVLGFLNSGLIYREIPIEKQAYDFQNLYDEGRLPSNISKTIEESFPAHVVPSASSSPT